MGTNLNFKNMENEPPADNSGGGSRPLGNYPLARQPSIYSLTFDEFCSTMGSLGKDYGSMNMDELLKSIWNAEETQIMANSTTCGVSAAQDVSGTPLQRQGSLTLPRTLSQKTVDEVWRDISKEYSVGKDGGGGGGSNMPPRQQTLGEMTLEEFLVRAGVVREEAQLAAKASAAGYFGDLSRSGNNIGLEIGFQQTGRGAGLIGNRTSQGGTQVHIQASNMPLNVNGVRPSQQQLHQPQPQQPQLFPKQPTVAYVSQLPLTSGPQIGNPGIRSGVMGITEQGVNSGLVQGTALQGGGMAMVSVGAGHIDIATGSPANQQSSDGVVKSNGDTSSVSPVPYVFNGGLRGRRCSGTLEKVIERRQRRMIKNRESAARSRARKQAYTMELEAEVAKLKEENQELRKKQEFLEKQKNQVLEMMNMQRGVKKQCLRRAQTWPMVELTSQNA